MQQVWTKVVTCLHAAHPNLDLQYIDMECCVHRNSFLRYINIYYIYSVICHVNVGATRTVRIIKINWEF